MSNKTFEICCDEGTLPRNIIGDVGKLGNQKKKTHEKVMMTFQSYNILYNMSH